VPRFIRAIGRTHGVFLAYRYFVDFGSEGASRPMKAVYCGRKCEYALPAPRLSARQAEPFRPRQQSTVTGSLLPWGVAWW
jgi:hypothetical protein